MKKNSSKLKHQEEQRAAVQQQTAQQKTALEFATPEELLRHDAGQVSPPPAVARRLGESIAREPRPSRSWWQRFLRL